MAAVFRDTRPHERGVGLSIAGSYNLIMPVTLTSGNVTHLKGRAPMRSSRSCRWGMAGYPMRWRWSSTAR